MIKRIIIVALLMVLTFAISYTIHVNVLTQNLSFSLLGVYLFHTIGAFFVYSFVEVVSGKLPNQAGYAYLMMMFLKIGVFVLIFKNSVFTDTPLTQVERVSLVLPLFLFLIVEALSVGRLLNSK